MTCQCGRQLAASAKFCGGCGAKVVAAAVPTEAETVLVIPGHRSRPSPPAVAMVEVIETEPEPAPPSLAEQETVLFIPGHRSRPDPTPAPDPAPVFHRRPPPSVRKSGDPLPLPEELAAAPMAKEAPPLPPPPIRKTGDLLPLPDELAAAPVAKQAPLAPPLMPPPALAPPPGPPPKLGHRAPLTPPPGLPPGPPPGLPVKAGGLDRGKFLLAGLAAVALLGVGVVFWLFTGGSNSGTSSSDGPGIFLTFDGLGDKSLTLKVITDSGSVLFSQTSAASAQMNAMEWRPTKPNDPFTGVTWGLLLENKAGKQMLIDRFGKKTLDPPGVPVSDFAEGLAAAQAPNGSCGYLDREHRFAVPATYERCLDFSNGLAIVAREGKHGYVNRRGQLQIPLQFLEACPFYEGLSAARTEQGWSVIDPQGKVVFATGNHRGCVRFTDGVAALADGRGVGYADRSGKYVIPAKYESGRLFADGRAFVRLEGKWRMIDHSGREIPMPDVSRVEDFEAGLARVQANGKWGLLDTSGKFRVEPTYGEIGPLVSGLHSANAPGKIGFLDAQGRDVQPPGKYCSAYAHGVFTCIQMDKGPQITGWASLLSPMGLMKNVDFLTRSGTRIGGLPMADLLALQEGKRR